MSVTKQILVPPMSARAFVVAAGQSLRITDTAGGQPGDFVALLASDPSIKLSQTRTRIENGGIAVSQGHRLWSNVLPPGTPAQPGFLFTITNDSAGPHDLLYPPCCRYALEKRFGVSRDGCLEHLASALSPWGLKPHEVPDPLNLFFRVAVDAAGRMAIQQPPKAPGGFIELRAEAACVVAISTCSVPIAGRENSGYVVELSD